MKKINLRDVPETEKCSPKGRFHSFNKEISIALGRDPRSFDLRQRHPFDLMLARIPPGASFCPFHAESAQWELYLVVSGHGTVRDRSCETEVAAGDAFLFQPGEAHELFNRGQEDFVYYVVADNPIGDSCFYPDNGKWAVFKEGSDSVIVRGMETDYFEGEE